MARHQAAHGAAALLMGTEEAATASYEACLARGSVAADTHDALLAAHESNGLFIQGRPLCSVLRPRFLSRARLAQLKRVSEPLARLFERAGDFLLSSDRLLDLVGASAAEREIWAIDPGYAGYTLTSRLDSFMVGDRIRFVEYNAESPAGIGFCDCLDDVFRNLPAAQSWDLAPREPSFEGRRHLLDTLLAAYREWGGNGVPSIAIIDWHDVLTRRDFELCAEFFRDNGVPTVIVDPRALTYRGGKVWAGAEQITLVYRRVLLHELLARAGEAEQLLRAYREGAVCMVNSPRSKLLHKKSVFALLSDRRLGLEMSSGEEKIVDETVPWTRIVVEGPTTYQGRTEDLIGLLRRHQDRFALKPFDDYGGRGVVLGWDLAEGAWETAIGTALEGEYIVQERVEVPEEPFPIWRDGRLERVTLYLDTDPLLFRGDLGGVLTRLSGSALLNVSAGAGSAAATFLVDDKEE